MTSSDGMSDASATLLEVRGISKHFGAVQALSDVTFEVNAAEVVGLVGDNGAGKSTLIKVISGIVTPNSGEYLVDGHSIKVKAPNDVTRLGVATVYQDLALCENLDVVANLYLGRELAGGGIAPLAALQEVRMERTALDLLARLRVTIPNVRTPIAALSGGQRQSVAVARSVMWNARVVLLDEPTAALGVVQTRQVLDLVKTLRDEGLGVVIISHNLADVFEVCDRIVVLRLGRRVATFEGPDLNRERVVAAITGAEFGNA
ncbi:MAG TPA: ATP-binding cassette domain-containing protein [Chloroflexota bacterium]|jgi:D-xylose transport system ATP-binding protein|nr:ATP-binding cassette domain-containing protein [Chloroflexota bacterium]